MAMVPEYDLRDIGPWEASGGVDETTATVWEAPDPLHNGQVISYSEVTQLYTNVNGDPIYFTGTAPGNAGRPPPEDVAQVGTPRELWVAGLTTEQWYAYTGLE